LLLEHGHAASPVRQRASGNVETLFSKAEKNYAVSYKHQETHYADFKVQPLVPYKYSQNGPGIAVADVNGDGLEDFFAAGAYNQSGQLFIQKKDGSFRGQALTSGTKYEEDMGVLLFDADGDGDRDLYVVSGGNEFRKDSPYYQDKLYFNDGKGNFTWKKDALPASVASGSCVVAADYDRDSDLDLFVGGRLTPHHYPQPGESLILQNEAGHFTDVTDTVAPGLRHIGMVTAALWTDYNNDEEIDLILAGEWMPVTFFRNEHGGLAKENKEQQVPISSGWWNSIQAFDADRDGDTDYVLGNLGLNSRYKTSSQEPVRVYVGDFNQDGTPDPLMAHYIQGVNRPAHPRDDLLQQVVSFKKRYPSYGTYAEATMESLLSETKATPQIYEAQTFATSCLMNHGNNGWELKPLPMEAQFAPIFGILTGDYTGDGRADLLLSGNCYAPDVLTGRYDASQSVVLKGDDKGNFKPIHPQESGLCIMGDAKGLAELITADGHVLVLAAQNDDTLQLWKNNVKPYQVLPVKDEDVYAMIEYSDGKKARQEFYYGSGYLSQSSRSIRISRDVVQVVIVDWHGKSRTINGQTLSPKL
jgi:hypothetical protein